MALIDLLNNPESFSLGQSSAYSAAGGSKKIKFSTGQFGHEANHHLVDRVEFFGDDSNGNGHDITFTSGRDWSGGKGLGGTAVPDFLLRGGDLENLDRRMQDVKRISKFLFSSPQGKHFILRQGALQVLNPQSNTRVFNLGGNLLAQIAAAGVSNIRRDGLVPSFGTEEGLGTLGLDKLLGEKFIAGASKLTGGDYVDLIGKSSTREEQRGTGDVGKSKQSKFIDFVPEILKKDRRNWNNTQVLKRDKVNYLSIFEVGAKGLDEVAKTYTDAQNADIDFVPFRFEVIDSDNPQKSYWIVFRAFLDTLQDNYTATHNEVKYNGRAERFYTYNAFDRKISLGFKIAAQTRDEMKPLYQKLNFLVSQTAPNYSSTGRIRTPYMRLTLGDYFNRVPGLLSNVSLSWNTNYPWEIKADNGKDTDMLILPHILDVSLNFQPIHSFTPHNNTNSENSVPFIGIDGQFNNEQDWTKKVIQQYSLKNTTPGATGTQNGNGNGNGEFLYYTVVSGDSPSGILTKLGITRTQLEQFNPDRSKLRYDEGFVLLGAQLKYKL